MKKLLIPCMVLILSASCSNTLADDIIQQEETTTETLDNDITQDELNHRYNVVAYVNQYLDSDFVIEQGKEFVEWSHLWGEEYTLPEEILRDMNSNIYCNQFFGYLNAVEYLRTTYYDAFGDTIEESTEWDYWCDYMDTFNIIMKDYNE